MQTRIITWGNSQGIRIPKTILDESGFAINDEIELSTDGNTILLKKSKIKKHISLQERLETFYGKPLSKISTIEQDDELDWGKNEGAEIW